MKNLDGVFHWVGGLEAASYLILLLIAMPLKYVWGWPMGVRVVGMAHGLLFLAYIGTAFAMYDRHDWPIKTLFWAVVASFLPFGPFVFEARALRAR
jgi:integral membrane protein